MPKIKKSIPEFHGFRQQAGGTFAFTMVPNQFLDEIVPFEKPCVVKVVALIIRRTIGWVDERGQRRQQEQVAYSEFAREMNMSTQAVADGLKIALEKGYIVRVKPGRMLAHGNAPGEGAWYSLSWSSASTTESANEEKLPVATDSNVTTYTKEPKTSERVYVKAAGDLPPEQLGSNPITASDSKRQSDMPVTDSKKQSYKSAESTLESRVMINKPESKKNESLELNKASSSFTSEKTLTQISDRIKQHRKSQDLNGKYSSYIGNIITEIGDLFGDSEHRLSNIKQALNLWAASFLGEKEFVQLLYQARDVTRSHTSAYAVTPSFNARLLTDKGGMRYMPSSLQNEQPRNRMPYFFRVLKGLSTGIKVSSSSTSKAEAPALPALHSGNPGNSIATCEAHSPAVEAHASAVQVIEKPEVLPEFPDLDEVPAMPAPDEFNSFRLEMAAQRRCWAERWSLDPRDTQYLWDDLLDRLFENRILETLATKTLGIEVGHARPELRSAVGLANQVGEDQQDNNVKFILVFRNAFDARYAKSYLPELSREVEKLCGKSVELYPVCF
ncbi:MAG TPA: hypothetical protein VH186_10575 [Chloroflexia bacterium]|nr:hypothetical protein [Chloroflexia bacterium]